MASNMRLASCLDSRGNPRLMLGSDNQLWSVYVDEGRGCKVVFRRDKIRRTIDEEKSILTNTIEA
jgi:hypothetical protein